MCLGEEEVEFAILVVIERGPLRFPVPNKFDAEHESRIFPCFCIEGISAP